MVQQLGPNWMKIAWWIVMQQLNSHNSRQHFECTQILELTNPMPFEMMSILAERIQNHKYLSKRSQFHWFYTRTHTQIWINSLNPKQHNIATIDDPRYNCRLPNNFKQTKKQQFPTIPIKLKVVAVKCASHGIPNALTICIIYGRKTIAAQNSWNALKLLANKNGFSVRLCRSSWHLSENASFKCWHRIDCSPHKSDAFCIDATWVWSCVNSSLMTSRGTQPRNHCNDFSAALGQFFINNQFGDSGIWFESKFMNEKTKRFLWHLQWIALRNKWLWQW